MTLLLRVQSISNCLRKRQSEAFIAELAKYELRKLYSIRYVIYRIVEIFHVRGESTSSYVGMYMRGIIIIIYEGTMENT